MNKRTMGIYFHVTNAIRLVFILFKVENISVQAYKVHNSPLILYLEYCQCIDTYGAELVMIYILNGQ